MDSLPTEDSSGVSHVEMVEVNDEKDMTIRDVESLLVDDVNPADDARNAAEVHPLLLKMDEHADDDINVSISKASRDRVFKFLLVVVFLGNVSPLFLSTADATFLGGAASTEWSAQAFTSTPFEFTMSKALLQATRMFGSALSGALIVPQAKYVGSKNIMIFYLFGGAVVYAITIFAIDVKRTGEWAYWSYIACKFAMGFFGGTISTSGIIISEIYQDPAEKISKTNMLMPMTLVSMVFGSMGGVVVIGQTGLLVSGAYVGIVLSLLGGIIAFTKLPRFRTPAEEKDDDGEKKVKGNKNIPVEDGESFNVGLYKKILFAYFLDSVGTTGLMGALTLVVFERFEQFKVQPSLVGISSSLILVFIIIGLTFAIPSLKKRGAGWNAIFGNLSTMIAQIVLVYMYDWIAFLAVLYIGYSCSFFSTVSYMPMIIMTVPQSRRAKVQGTYGMIGDLVRAICPIGIALIVDYYGGSVALFTCAAFSLFGTFASLPLYKNFGKPVPPPPFTAEEKKTMNTYENLMDPFDKVKRNRKRLADGNPPIKLKFGSFTRDMANLDLIRRKGVYDFKVYSMNCREALLKVIDTNDEEGSQIMDRVGNLIEANFESYERGEMDEQFQDMGRWMGDYLTKSGYNNSLIQNPAMFKALIMSVFPPLPPLDTKIRTRKNFTKSLKGFVRWLDESMRIEIHADHQHHTFDHFT